MKKVMYALCAAVCVLFAMVSCSKSDKNEPKRFDIPSETETIISEEFIAKMANNGMIINEGINPPNIEGVFATGILKMIYTSLEKDFPIGEEIKSYRFKFYDQVGTRVKTDYVNEAFINEEQATGRGTIISGSGNKFTAYLDMNIIDSGIKTRDVSVLSGEITPNGIKDFQYGFLKIEKTGDFQNKLVPERTIRIWVSKDKLAVRKKQYPTGD
ncbi:hypothetical protein [Capnocytophaga granulosa]|jgi:hypothetical protein|uniref:hypothetical protein n=1 Tax=Capnocytophaga granulosa TaxID=45242 RepID=UPI0023EF5FA2|nr:hypothetical protein [Capnocytophaga granulosa]